MKVTLDIPDSYALLYTLASIEKGFKLSMALMLVRQGKISVSRGAELAELEIYEFLNECKKNEIPVIEYSEQEILDEFEALKQDLL